MMQKTWQMSCSIIVTIIAIINNKQCNIVQIMYIYIYIYNICIYNMFEFYNWLCIIIEISYLSYFCREFYKQILHRGKFYQILNNSVVINNKY